MTFTGGGDPREWLGKVKSEYWEQEAASEDPEGDPGTLHVLFEVAGRRFAVDARCCKGVFRKPEITELPGLPAHVLGVVGVRGEMISATDPARYLGVTGARPERTGYLLILADGELRTALWVDRVFEVVPLGAADWAPVDVPGPEERDGVILGRLEGTEAEIWVIDGRKFLAGTAVVGTLGFGAR